MELNIPLVNFHPPSGLLPRYRLNDELSENIQSYKDVLKDSGIILTIENLPAIGTFRRFFINRLKLSFQKRQFDQRKLKDISPLLRRMMNNMRQIVKFAEDNDIYVTFDTTHIGTTGLDLLAAYDVFKDRIANIHLSDYDGRLQHLLPGTGYLPLERLLDQAKRDGYNGTITLETCPAAMEHTDKAKAARNAETGLKYIKNALNW
jgi:hypothetical protein